MPVTLTSPVLGQPVGFTYTGDLEEWLLAQGYARQDGYTGPGVANVGATDVLPADDPTLASNRDEAPYWPDTEDRNTSIANDKDHLTKAPNPAPGFDFDEGGQDDDAPTGVELTPAEGPAVGGTVVTLTGDNLEGATGVTFGGAAGTDFTLADGVVTVTTPAGTAGPVDVVVTDPDGDYTATGGFTYTA